MRAQGSGLGPQLRLHTPVALVAVALICIGVRAAPTASPAPPTRRSFTGTQSWSQYVTMRDGVRIAVDVHLPKGLAPGERTATVLHMSRYYRSVDIRSVWRPFVGFGIYPVAERDIREPIVKAGYSWVDADVRGSGASFGHEDYPLSADEVRDASDLLDWITAQPWAAGPVAATGVSYDGTLASLLLRNHHPALKVVVPRFSGWDAYGDVFFPGGLKAASLLKEWADLTKALDRGRITDVFGWTGGVVARGVRPVDPALLPQAMAEHAVNPDLMTLLGGLVYRDDPDPQGSGRVMDDFSPHTLGAGVADIPVYTYGGWFDGALSRGAVRQFLANRATGTRLRLGPWFHAGEFNASPYANDEGDFNHAREVLRFLDYHLRGVDQGFSSEARVQYFTMGDERWKSAPTWPPPGGVSQSFFLGVDHTLTTEMPTLESATDRYRVDPMATTGDGSRWGLIVGTGLKRGYSSRREADRRLLTYTTTPLARSFEVTGHPIVHLFLTATATDGAVFAYLEDVRSNGEVRYITEGELRLSSRKTGISPILSDPVPFHSYLRADSEPLVPGAAIEVVFDLLPTSFVFRPGDAIRLGIAGADAGTFAAPIMAGELVYDVLRDRSHRSRVELPSYAR